MRSIGRRHPPAVLAAACVAAGLLSACAATGPVKVDGVFWQPDAATARPAGTWDRVGARELIVQWLAVDGAAFAEGAGPPLIQPAPDWDRIGREPWAASVILGLAGRYDEPQARRELDLLIEQSRRVAALRPPVNVAGWYFPVEADPTWPDAARMGGLLAGLPRPLWVSVYDKGNIGPEAFAAWVRSWAPEDVGVLFQDGVGEHVRDAPTAAAYADALTRTRGAVRTAIVAEAFRPRPGGGFRAATADELRRQLRAYGGRRVYLFDGPHYVPDAVVEALARPGG
ncbi:hypothetical protein C5708_03840 [Caulobacter sp. CCUG 60055]|nr:hypothetical protein [Caulobacter sp. CCUG 60055]